LYLGQVQSGGQVEHATDTSRGLWLQVIEGEVEALGNTFGPGDAAAIEEIDVVNLQAKSDSKFLLFDMA
jgi:redox-sensitive bicupin YhaK (pirin superfamily)